MGACLSCFACGITLSLSTRYWARFHVDRLWIRFAAVLAMVLAMIDTAFNGAWAYKVRVYLLTASRARHAHCHLPVGQWTTTYYILPDKLSLLPWELTSNCFVMSTSIVLAQHFFLYRLFSLSGKNWFVIAPVSVAALGCWGVGIYMGWYCSKHPNSIASYADITCVFSLRYSAPEDASHSPRTCPVTATSPGSGSRARLSSVSSPEFSAATPTDLLTRQTPTSRTLCFAICAAFADPLSRTALTWRTTLSSAQKRVVRSQSRPDSSLCVWPSATRSPPFGTSSS